MHRPVSEKFLTIVTRKPVRFSVMVIMVLW
jgi:hypothetical protein